MILAEFATASATIRAACIASDAGNPAQDVLSPIPLEGVAVYLAPSPETHPIGWVMFFAGAIGAALGWSMQWYSAVIDYPVLSGGRPLNSWAAFLLVPYETTILAAGIVGLLGWMWMCGLPRLFHPLFEAPILERAVQDRFLLAFPNGNAAWIEAHLKPNALHEVRS